MKLKVQIKDLKPGDILNSGRVFDHLVPVERYHLAYQGGTTGDFMFNGDQEIEVTRSPKQVRAADAAGQTLAWGGSERFAVHQVKRDGRDVVLLGWKNGVRYWWDTDAASLFDLAD